jgi:glutamate-1-semialdehyde aminotransferase
MRKGLGDIFSRAGFDFQTTGVGSLVGCHFTKTPIVDMATSSTGDKELAKRFSAHLLDNQIFVLSSELTHGAISTAHSNTEIDEFLAAADTFARRERTH